jgi:hypothetical protein
MADTFIKQATGEFMKDSNGIYLKSRPFNQQVIQDGLSFWGSADPNYLTLIDGLVSEAYDIRGTGQKMIQNTVANRPILLNNSLLFDSTDILSKANESAKTMFVVINAKYSGTLGVGGIGTSQADGLKELGSLWSNQGYTQTSSPIYMFYNSDKRSTAFPAASISNVNVILHSFYDFNIINKTMLVGGALYSSSGSVKIIEWGWYNRVLTEPEVIYNINALNAKYSIF